MTYIGTFTATRDGFEGRLQTLTLDTRLALVPAQPSETENAPDYQHVAEGPDDMPAHIKAALTQTSLSIPVSAGRMALGTWQGIYLFEHRDAPHTRRVVAHFLTSG